MYRQPITLMLIAIIVGLLLLALGTQRAYAATTLPVTASGGQSTYALSVTTVGGGIVTKQPNQATYLAGTFVNLTATAAEGYAFSGWSGACTDMGVCTVTMDGATSVTATFNLISSRPNDPPTFTSTPRLSATAGANYTYAIVANDPDAGDNLTLSAPAKPHWLTLTPAGNGTAILSGTPSSADLGAHIMRLRVLDASGALATQEFILIVDAPDPTVTGSIQGMVVDADGNGLGGAMVTRSAGSGEVAGMTVDSKITDNNGSYRFEAVQPGDYTIAASLDGQGSATLIEVTVLPGQPATVVSMTLQPVQISLYLPMAGK